MDRPALRALPPYEYVYQHISFEPVGKNYHISYDGHLYSVPYQHRNERVEVRATCATVEIYLNGKRIASHQRSNLKGKATTVKEHRPKEHQQYGDWSTAQLLESAQKIGPATTSLVQLVMTKHPIVEQGYKVCLGILRLRKTVGNDRLEAACRRAVHFGAHTLKSIQSILDTGLDRCPLPEKPRHLVLVHCNVRGADAFNTSLNKENNHANSADNRESENNETDGNGEVPGSPIADAGLTGTNL
jgi:hypothetical protein